MTGFREIRDTLVERIRAGQLRAGEFLPSEIELAAEFGVARATVSRALGDLAEAGVVERRRRAGTRVALAPVRRARLDIAQAPGAVAKEGKAYSYRLIDADYPVPPQVSGTLGARVLSILCLHLADDQPWQAEERWISLAVAPFASSELFATDPPGPQLMRDIPLTDAEFHFHAEPARGRIAEALGIADGTASFVAERSTWSEEQPVTVARLWHAPGYRLTLARGQAVPGGA